MKGLVARGRRFVWSFFKPNKSFSARAIQFKIKEKNEGKYKSEALGIFTKHLHLSPLTSMNLLHQVKFSNYHGSCLSYSLSNGHVYTTFHKPKYYFIQAILFFIATGCVILYPIVGLSIKFQKKKSFLDFINQFCIIIE